MRIAPIQYGCGYSCEESTTYVTNPSFGPQYSGFPSSFISIHPNSFPSQKSSSLTTIRDRWFLSSSDIPCNIQCFLRLGENFTLPFNNKNKIIFECIKGIESSTQRMPIDRRIEVTNHAIPILNQIISSPIFTSPVDKQLLNMESDMRTFVSAHPNIIFMHADKGNVTVAIDRDAYMTKITTLLGHVCSC